MICVNCGKEIKDDSAFCGFCGTPVAASASDPVPVPAEETAPAAEPVQPAAESAPASTAETAPAAEPVQPTAEPAPVPTQPAQSAYAAQNQIPVSPTPMYAQPVGAIPPAVPAEAGGKKKKGKAGLIILIVALVLLLVGGGAAAAFLFLNSSPTKKINKALEAGDIETVVKLYGNLSADKDKEEISEKLLAYAEEVGDDYFEEEIDYTAAIETLNLLADASLETDDEIEDIRDFVNRIHDSRESYAAGEDYRANGEYALALEKYDDVIAEDTRYYDKAQTAFEEVKQELINATLDEVYALMNSGDYLAADNLLNEVNLAIPGGSSELTDAHLAVQAAMEDSMVSEVIEDANIAIAEGRYSEAQQMLEDMLAVYPNNTQLQNAIAGLSANTDASLIGTWKLDYDMCDLIVEELGDDFAGFNSPLIITLMFEFNEDGSFRMYLSEDFKDNLDNWMDDFIDFTAEYFYSIFEEEGMSRDEAEEVFEMFYGSSLKDFLRDELDSEMEYAIGDIEDLINTEETARYEVDGNRIYLSDDYGNIDYSSYEIFEVQGNLMMLSQEGGSTEEIFPGLSYPLTFIRVSENY